MRLLVSARDGLVVVVPRRSEVRRVPELLRRHAAWIDRAMERTAERRAHLAERASAPLPEVVNLPAVGLAIRVEYAWGLPGTRACAVERGGVLVVSAAAGDVDAVRAALRRWLTRTARARLVPMLEEVSRPEGLPYTRVTVRAQRTRWGSCSRAGAISLNRSLLFLRPELARSVLVHELVHTLRHDHSPAFWALLRERVPEADKLRRELRQAWRDVPAWAEEG